MSLPGEEPLPETPLEALQEKPPTPKRRLRSVTIKSEEIAQRVVTFYDDDLESRAEDRKRRIQRYAKFRMWSEGGGGPWQGSSDLGLPDMLEKSLRVQDTLHNAVMATRPNVINVKSATDANKGKEETIGKLLDYQVFVEAQGENKIGDMIDSFVNDGCFTVFTPWVKEKRDVCERMEYPFPSDQEDFFQYLQGLVSAAYPNALDIYPENEEGEAWEWCAVVSEEEKHRISFYTEEDATDEADKRILSVTKKYVTVHDGPVIIPLDYDDVITPAGVGNLQPPGPANPGGSPHVLLRSYPTIDEIKTLAAQGYYDLITPGQLEGLRPETMSIGDNVKKDALDRLQGQAAWKDIACRGQNTVTRLICFDRYDIDGDGLAEDVVFWVLVEPKIVLRARHLSEVFPAKVPRRPLAEATFIPAGGRREGISLLEMQEGIHDMQKALFDIITDATTLGSIPFFFYRMSGALKPEMLRLFPGMGVPVGDPHRDVSFPSFSNANNSALGMGLNLISMVSTWGDKATMIGDLQLGRVPAGRSSALRTTGSMSMVQAQGDARPERILRRFLTGLCQMYANIHDLNCAFLPRQKQFRVSGVKRPDEDPYVTIDGRDAVDGVYEFEFEANAVNTSKATMQQALMQVAGAFLTPLGIQAGLIQPDNIYNIFRDLGKSFGLSVDRYITPPNPEASLPPISAEDALTQIAAGNPPYGRPLEGTQPHMEKLMAFAQTDDIGNFTEAQVKILALYMQQLMMKLQAEQQQAAMMQAAQQFQQAQQGSGGQPADPGGAPTQNQPNPDQGPAPVSGGAELQDESLPGAGGGGQEMQQAAE